jgi:transposase InsO family protein
MKSRVGYPKKPFATLDDAQTWVNRFVVWYNEEHRHSALNWVTPMARHTGAEHELLRRRSGLEAPSSRPVRSPTDRAA